MATAPTRVKLNPSYWRHKKGVPFSEDISPSSLFLKHNHFLVIDIETKQAVQDIGGWDHINRLEISVACAYDSKTDKYIAYRENELKQLIELCETRLVVGYNVRGFDLQVMTSYGLNPKRIDVFDIMYDLENLTRQRYLKLEAVARGTIGSGKTADGLQAIQWWKEGEIQKIIDYCMQDVKVTHEIFQFGRQNGFVRIQRSDNNITEVPVQWN